ncbi:MAG TPA: hypothetical protein VK054_00510 [Beutenbergiaceae bacterium]|nr:hypothetical protein [Beutenbergiaceae bacterium]
MAAKLERAARNHYGMLGPELVRLINEDAPNIPLTIEAAAVTIRNHHQTLRGDDAINLALLQFGLNLLSTATNTPLPIRETVAWLATSIGQQRTRTIDRETKCLTEIINTVYAQQWLERDLNTNFVVDHLVIHGEYIAFRGTAASANSPLEVNPNSRLVKQILREHDFVNPGPDWARRGWLETKGDRGRVGFQKRHKGQIVGRFWRFTDEALRVAGVASENEETGGE